MHYGKKLAYCEVDGQNVMPVVKLTGANYNEVSGTYTPGYYAWLFVNSTQSSPSLNDINALLFPTCPGADASPAVETDYAYGAERMKPNDEWELSQIPIESTSQYVVVGEYDLTFDVLNGSDTSFNMAEGFAAEFFE